MRLGYACINQTLSGRKGKAEISCNKTCRMATAISKGEESGFPRGSEGYSKAIYDFLTNMSLKNLEAMYSIISWSKNNGIFFYRMSSDMFPHIGNEKVREHMSEKDWENYSSLYFAAQLIYDIGKYVQKYNIRLTMHPDHFNQLGSEKSEVVMNTFTDLAWHATLLLLLEKGADAYITYSKQRDPNYNEENVLKHGVLCIHGGGTYGDKKSAIERWKSNFRKLPEFIQKRICLENCEKGYKAEDLLPVCEELNIPLIFDFHHYACWRYYHQDEDGDQSEISVILPRILKTWEVRGIIPKFHLSDQAEDKKVGAHHDYVESIPDELLELHKSGYKIDIMIEAKKKELATLKLYEKYPHLKM